MLEIRGFMACDEIHYAGPQPRWRIECFAMLLGKFLFLGLARINIHLSRMRMTDNAR